MRSRSLAFLAAGLIFAGAAAAQPSTATPAEGRATNPPKSAQDDKPSIPAGEARFLRNAADHGMAEAELGRLGQQKGMHDEVKQFANRMVEDHERANMALQGLAAKKAVTLPDRFDRKHEKEMEKLKKLVGPEFDRAYMERLVDAHEKDVGDFRKMAKSAKDPDVKKFAAEQLAVIESHLRAARATRDVTQGSARTGERATGSKKP